MQRFPSYFDAFAIYICWNFGYTRAYVDRPSATKIPEIFICPFCLRTERVLVVTGKSDRMFARGRDDPN